VKLNLKICAILIIAALLLSSVYVIFFNNETNIDNAPPNIDTITGNTSGKKGDFITISVTFSDNIEVTNATIYYRISSDREWISKSILSGSIDILLNSNENVYYYVTVDDAEGNGPIGEPSDDGSIYFTIIVSDDDSSDDEFFHTVLVEEASYTDCYYCPLVADILYDLYSSDNYNFYYVTLIKTVDKAISRLDNEYNLFGLPTVFVDGGYKVLLGGLHEKSEYAQAIRDAEARNVPKVRVTVNAEFDNNTHNLINNILVENKEEVTYNGRLRVYLTEIVSRWTGPEGEPYHYGFLDYITNKEISIGPNDNVSFSDTRDISDLDPENLMIIAAVFNSEKKQGYSKPSDENPENPFDAYYADAVDGTEVVEGGNLPPVAGIRRPTLAKLHLFGHPLIKTLSGTTILIGRTTIEVNATDDSRIEKVEFYIDGKLKNSTADEPYEWSFRKIGLFKHIIRKHTILVKVYDDGQKMSYDSINVITIML
jgi:hypothetical protein